MTALGDNDATCVMLFTEHGNAIDAVEWPVARERLTDFLMAGTSNADWAAQRAEDLLCAMFTGRATASTRKDPS